MDAEEGEEGGEEGGEEVEAEGRRGLSFLSLGAFLYTFIAEEGRKEFHQSQARARLTFPSLPPLPPFLPPSRIRL
jgi:hypothetical protein